MIAGMQGATTCFLVLPDLSELSLYKLVLEPVRCLASINPERQRPAQACSPPQIAQVNTCIQMMMRMMIYWRPYRDQGSNALCSLV